MSYYTSGHQTYSWQWNYSVYINLKVTTNYKQNFMRRIHITSSFSSPIHEVNPRAFDPHLESRIALKEKRTDKVFFCFFHTNKDKKNHQVQAWSDLPRGWQTIYEKTEPKREREKKRWMKTQKTVKQKGNMKKERWESRC